MSNGKEEASFSPEVSALHVNGSNKSYAFKDDKIIAVSTSNNSEVTVVDNSILDDDAKKAIAIRKNILDGINNNSIEPVVIELVERKFREEVLANKKQKTKSR